MRRSLFLVFAAATVALVPSANAAAPSWAAAQIASVVEAGLMAESVQTFRPRDPLRSGELAVVLASVSAEGVQTDDPNRLVTLRELNARLVTAAGLRAEARRVRQTALLAGLAAPTWLGTETLARLLGLRINHPREQDALELQLSQPVTRAEAAYSIARLLALEPSEVEALTAIATTFTAPAALTEAQAAVLSRALKLVGSPYVWAGTSERPQLLGGKTQPGGFDCSGLVWRVYKLERLASAPRVAGTLRGRTSFVMSGEVPHSARVARASLQPADVVFFGTRGPRSTPNEVGHMGIYLGNGWIVHSSSYGTTLQPLTGWYEKSFAWGRNVLAEAGYARQTRAPATGARSTTS